MLYYILSVLHHLRAGDSLQLFAFSHETIRWPVADGYALYRVTSAKPLKVQHLHFGDGYSVFPETIRGLTISDVANMVARSLAWKAACEKARAKRS